MSTVTHSVYQTALATEGVTDLMYQYFCYMNDMPIYLIPGRKGARLNMEKGDDSASLHSFNLMMLVDINFDAIVKQGGSLIALQYFHDWITEVFDDPIILDRASHKLSKAIHTGQSKAKWEREFIRGLAQDKFISSHFTPSGDVHYRYLYKFDALDGFYKSQRYLATDFDDDFWDTHQYWFDYYGPEEDEQGLIRHLDYCA
ncbi:hypothetical protein [Shewanella aestuarii]|uniref:Uncharacterized protein n=1 Tax=Shewanella aestuarii TaxID=1028752 RepID=A0A6G9QR65_9GAMM|nr:hypothetical protein [Shewanella aestuarii]QIR16593.1 hypothetical protein HBH39_19145 [Shewanella aestuarii]